MLRRYESRIKVLIAEDSPEMGLRLCDMLSEIDNIEIVGVALDGRTALSLQGYYFPDVVMMDLHMPGICGPELIKLMHQRNQACSIIVLTAFEEENFLSSSLAAGADFFMSKTSDFEVVRQTLYASRSTRHE